MFNLEDVINDKPKILLTTLSVILVIIFVLSLMKFKFYNVYETNGYYLNNSLNIYLPTSFKNILNSYEKVLLNNTEKTIKINEVGELLIEPSSLTNYQIIIANVNETFLENEVVSIKFLYEKSSITQKVLKKIFWKEEYDYFNESRNVRN